MAGSSGTYKDAIFNDNGNIHGSVTGHFNVNPVHGEWDVPTFHHQKTIYMNWGPEDQVLLENGLNNYSSDLKIVQYAKIAVELKNKTVRDVALRCRWMARKGISKRRNQDFSARKIKDRNERVIDSLVEPSSLAIQSSLPYAQGMTSNSNNYSLSYNDAAVGGATRQLIEQNDWVLKQISANLATRQIGDNICLLSQARDNIFQILSNLNNMRPTMKNMPPLPKLDEELANSILPTAAFRIQ